MTPMVVTPSLHADSDAELSVSRDIDERGHDRFRVTRDGVTIILHRFDAARLMNRLRVLLDLTDSHTSEGA